MRYTFIIREPCVTDGILFEVVGLGMPVVSISSFLVYTNHTVLDILFWRLASPILIACPHQPAF